MQKHMKVGEIIKDLEKVIKNLKKDSSEKFKSLQKRSRRKQGIKDRYKVDKDKNTN